MFPQDFHWPGDEWRPYGKSERPVCREVEDSLRENLDGDSSVPIMDGGVYDNQGITSIILTLARKYQLGKHEDDDTLWDEISALEPVRPRDWAKWLLGNMENASETEKQKESWGRRPVYRVRYADYSGFDVRCKTGFPVIEEGFQGLDATTNIG